MTTHVSIDDRAEAAHQEKVTDQWRDWRRYLQAHRTLIADRQEARTRLPSFEQDLDSLESQASAAETILAALPSARRALFDREREVRRTALRAQWEQDAAGQQRLLDPDALDQVVLDDLLDEALGKEDNGTDNPPGWGMVPMGEDRWYTLDVAALDDAPPAGAYALRRGGVDDRRKRIILAGVALVIGIGILALYYLWPHAAPVAAPIAGSTVNGTLLTPWPLTQLVVTTPSGSTTVPVTATTGLHWPSVSAAGGGYWRSPQSWPLALCVDPTLFATMSSVDLASDGTGVYPTRRYHITDQQPTPLDLLLNACGTPPEGAPSVRYGQLVATEAPPTEPMSKSVALNAHTSITVQDIAVVGPGDDPTLPTGQVQVLVRASGPPNFDWPTLAPTLHLATGASSLPSAIATTPQGTELRYLVASYPDELAAIWVLTPPNGSSARQWRATLPPPRSRDAVLRDALQLQDARITEGTPTDPRATVLHLAIINRAITALVLTHADLTVAQGRSNLEISDPPNLTTPLKANEARDLAVVLPRASSSDPLIVTVGVARVRVRPVQP